MDVPLIQRDDAGGTFIDDGNGKAAAHQVRRQRSAQVIDLADLETLQPKTIEIARHFACNSESH
jgi:hypothetical protein